MKTIKLFTILALMLLTSVTANAQNSLVGDVNKDGRVNITDVTMVVDIILHGQKELSLSVNEISLSKGNSATIVITSGYGSYTVSSNDTNIADATLSGSTVIITGKSGGTTVVKVIDTISGNMEEVSVKVLAPLSFSANSAELVIGETTTINIISGNGNYEVTSSNVNVVEASLSGTTIVLTGKAKGNATVTVKDVVSGSTANISVTVKDAPISYPACPDENHPHLIDLGLPSGTKWACCNVDADMSEAYGSYWCWGQGVGVNRDFYSEIIPLGEDISGTEYDVAHVKWGGKWCIPTLDNIMELQNYCTCEWTTVNGVNGMKFTSKSNNCSIFLPAAGWRSYDFYGAGENGSYWSSTFYDVYGAHGQYYDAYELGFCSNEVKVSCTYAEGGRSVRPVVRNPACPDGNHPHLIDLGLPSGTKWACCNVGADKPEASGGYYAWGETEEKDWYDGSTYILGGGSSSTFHDLGDISGTQYDVAHVKWGGKGCMPTSDDIKELLDNCTYKYTMLNHAYGMKFSSKSNNCSIFLPAAQYRWDCHIDYDLFSCGYYWSSTPYSNYSGHSYCFFINYGNGGIAGWSDTMLFYGQSVRPVVRN